MRLRRALAIFGICILSASRVWADAAQDWEEILALESGPAQPQWKTRAEARSATLAHLSRQEKTLRNFIVKYPGDARRVDAQLRLAHLLAVRADFESNEKARAESAEILNRLASNPSTPREQLADVEFAKLSLFMRRVSPSDANARQALLDKAQTFQKSFPQDRRLAALLAEIATLFDSDPAQKKSLLEQAQALSGDDEVKQRISDDLKRIAMLN